VLLGLIILSFVMTFYGRKKDPPPDNGADPAALHKAATGGRADPSGNPLPVRTARPPVAAL